MNARDATAHERWEELAAGYALDALEPDEELAFADHLRTCAQCRAVLDEHSYVAAQLGALAEDSDITTPSWSRIRAGVLAGPPPVVLLDDERTRRRRPPRLLGAAAAAVLLAGAGVAAWQLTEGHSHPPTQAAAIARCEHTPACHVVRLDGKAVVLADATQATVIPTALPSPATGRVYALWQLPRAGRPLLVTTVTSFTNDKPGPPTGLTLPYRDTAAFALSIEPAGVVPSQPTQVIATGTATA